MAKTVKLTKMVSNDYPHPTDSGSEGLIHINLQNEVITGYQTGKKGAQGHLLSPNCQRACEEGGNKLPKSL
jgi:hypothetical protein